MSDWYARRVARQRQEAPPFQPVVQRQTPAPYQGQPEQTQVSPLAAHLRGMAPGEQRQGFPGQVTIENFGHAMAFWKGGKGQKEQEPCPNCGHTLWSRQAGPSRMPPPAPMCYHCGYNGLFEQGLQSSWGG